MKLFKKVVFLAMLLAGTLSLSACGKDTTNPVITGAVNLEVEVNSAPNYLDGVSATDNKDGNVTSHIIVDSTDVNLSLLGTYELSYSVTDEGGNDFCVTVYVTVVDNTLPVLSGASNLTVEVNSNPNWLDGITATDNYNGDLTSCVTVDLSAVDLSTLGTYNLVYIVADGSTNESSVTVTVTVVDTTAPEILGAVNLQIEAKSNPSWIHDISATDNYDGDLTSSISVDSSDVNLNIIGTYDLVYTVHDSSDNEKSVTVSVTVVDTTDPEILGAENLEVEANSTPNWLTGITATDNYDLDVTSSVTVDATSVDLTKTGTYDLVYTAHDSSDNEKSVTVTVTVVDTTAPQILGAVDIDVEAGSTPDYLVGVTATDSYDGDLTSSIIVDDSDVDLLVQGSYDLVYAVEDASGNTDSVSVVVTIVDSTAPEILGATDLIVEARTGLTPNWLDGVTAIDNLDGDVTSHITVNDEDVNLDVLGIYVLSYDVIDDNNNEAIVNVNVEVVYVAPQRLVDLDIALLTELKGIAPTAEELILIQSASVLRAENYGMIYIPGTILNAESIQQMFIRILTADEIQIIIDYDTLWVNSLGGPFAEGLGQYDIQRIMYSFLLSRQMTEAESSTLPKYAALETEYNLSFEGGVDPRFDEATIAQIEGFIGRSLTADELNTLAVQAALSDEMMGTMMSIMLSKQIGRGLTLVEIDAVGLISNYLVDLSGEGGLPSVEDAQSTLCVEFTPEELAAYGIVKDMYNEVMFNMVISQFETQIGREVTEEETAQLHIYIVVMFEYMAKYDVETDPEFQIATNAKIELIIERSLTEAEIASLEYINVTMTIAMIENQIGRSLTETEKAAIPVVNAINSEYDSLYETGVDPEIEQATNSQIEAVLGRSLTQTELDALVIFRVILAEMPND